MKQVGFNIRAVISDNHSTAFAFLLKPYGTENPNRPYLIYFENQKIYIMFDCPSYYAIISLAIRVLFSLLLRLMGLDKA